MENQETEKLNETSRLPEVEPALTEGASSGKALKTTFWVLAILLFVIFAGGALFFSHTTKMRAATEAYEAEVTAYSQTWGELQSEIVASENLLERYKNEEWAEAEDFQELKRETVFAQRLEKEEPLFLNVKASAAELEGDTIRMAKANSEATERLEKLSAVREATEQRIAEKRESTAVENVEKTVEDIQDAVGKAGEFITDLLENTPESMKEWSDKIKSELQKLQNEIQQFVE